MKRQNHHNTPYKSDQQNKGLLKQTNNEFDCKNNNFGNNQLNRDIKHQPFFKGLVGAATTAAASTYVSQYR